MMGTTRNLDVKRGESGATRGAWNAGASVLVEGIMETDMPRNSDAPGFADLLKIFLHGTAVWVTCVCDGLHRTAGRLLFYYLCYLCEFMQVLPGTIRWYRSTGSGIRSRPIRCVRRGSSKMQNSRQSIQEQTSRPTGRLIPFPSYLFSRPSGFSASPSSYIVHSRKLASELEAAAPVSFSRGPSSPRLQLLGGAFIQSHPSLGEK